MPLLTDFQQFIKEKNLLPASGPTLLAVSGGVDSVVMAWLFKNAGLPFGIVHCNFLLRGAESDGDAKFVRKLATKLRVRFFTQIFDTQVFAEQNDLSVQLAARQLRYDFFEKIRSGNSFDCIATAHNLDDSVETTIFNLIRGTGLAGLQGIPLRNGHVVRPLLFAQRAEIEAFARENNIVWREDSSNAKDDYSRNFIRHHVLPTMKKLNPALLETVARAQARLAAAQTNLDHLAETFFQKITTIENSIQHIEKQALAQLPHWQFLLFEKVKKHGFTEEQLRQLDEGFEKKIGLELLAPDGFRLVNDRKNLLLCPPKTEMPSLRIEADDLMVSLPDGSRLVITPAATTPPFPNGVDRMIVDAAKIQFPLLLRPWRAGDVFQPLGMDGRSQKLQDFFTNRKISRAEKERVWLLENGRGEIVWLLGHRPDERFKITPETQKALKFSWIR